MKKLSVGVSWRESLRDLLRKTALQNIAFDTTGERRRFYSSENNMPSSNVTDCASANSQPVELRFAKLTENAFAPSRGSKLAAGFDLHRL